MLKIYNIIFVYFLITFLSSCSSVRPAGKTEAEVLYKEAVELMSDKRYILATEKLNTLRSQYPYSFYATHAELMQADILFKQENFIEAASAYILFKDFHPKHEKLAYVINQIGESFYKQLPSTIDRDLTPAQEAIKYYDELLRVFPSSEFAKSAQEKMTDCQSRLEAREKYIADFYFKTKVYDAALFRYQDILKNFKTPELRDHCMLRIAQASMRTKNYIECVKYAQQFIGEIQSPQSKKELQSLENECTMKSK